jgi:hypothetical protein
MGWPLSWSSPGPRRTATTERKRTARVWATVGSFPDDLLDRRSFPVPRPHHHSTSFSASRAIRHSCRMVHRWHSLEHCRRLGSSTHCIDIARRARIPAPKCPYAREREKRIVQACLPSICSTDVQYNICICTHSCTCNPREQYANGRDVPA